MHCLICMHLPSGTARARALYVHIWKCTLVCVTTIAYFMETLTVRKITLSPTYTVLETKSQNSIPKTSVGYSVILHHQ